MMGAIFLAEIVALMCIFILVAIVKQLKRIADALEKRP